MAVYPAIVACLFVFIVISLRRRDRLIDGRPDVTSTERTLSYWCAGIAAALVVSALALQ